MTLSIKLKIGLRLKLRTRIVLSRFQIEFILLCKTSFSLCEDFDMSIAHCNKQQDLAFKKHNRYKFFQQFS